MKNFQESKQEIFIQDLLTQLLPLLSKELPHIEKCDDAVAFGSGMGAITAVCMAFCKSNSNIVCSSDVFGTSINVFKTYMSKFGVELRFAQADNIEEWAKNIDTNTCLVFLESPSNPIQKLADISAIAQFTKKHNAIFVVDNTFLTPIFQNPCSLGCDLVLHSAGKYMDGQGRAVLGIVAGKYDLIKELKNVLRTLGLSASPFNAWLILKGIETLGLRMHKISQTTYNLANWLIQTKIAKHVFYTGLPSHPQHQLALLQQTGHGGIVSFDIDGTMDCSNDKAWQFIDGLQLIAKCTNIGDTRTMVTHPATTTHCKVSAADKKVAGISNGLIRISVGLEDFECISADIQQSYQKISLLNAIVIPLINSLF